MAVDSVKFCCEQHEYARYGALVADAGDKRQDKAVGRSQLAR